MAGFEWEAVFTADRGEWGERSGLVPQIKGAGAGGGEDVRRALAPAALPEVPGLDVGQRRTNTTAVRERPWA